MVARSILALRLRHSGLQASLIARRSLASNAPLLKQKAAHAKPKPVAAESHKAPPPPPIPPRSPESWLTRYIKKSPAAKRVFMAVVGAMGYNSPKQVAGRQAFMMYERLCVPKPQEDREFWQEGESLTCTRYDQRFSTIAELMTVHGRV
jgi:cytochrome b pre-mRNA-processing protein 3